MKQSIVSKSLLNIADAIKHEYLLLDRDGFYYHVPPDIRRSGKMRIRPTQVEAVFKKRLITIAQYSELIKKFNEKHRIS